MTRTTRRNFIGRILGTATAAVLAPKLLAKETPGEVLGILRRGEQTFTMHYPKEATWLCSGAFIPELDRVPFDVTTYRAAGEL